MIRKIGYIERLLDWAAVRLFEYLDERIESYFEDNMTGESYHYTRWDRFVRWLMWHLHRSAVRISDRAWRRLEREIRVEARRNYAEVER
jgi:hypothetical protein